MLYLRWLQNKNITLALVKEAVPDMLYVAVKTDSLESYFGVKHWLYIPAQIRHVCNTMNNWLDKLLDETMTTTYSGTNSRNGVEKWMDTCWNICLVKSEYKQTNLSCFTSHQNTIFTFAEEFQNELTFLVWNWFSTFSNSCHTVRVLSCVVHFLQFRPVFYARNPSVVYSSIFPQLYEESQQSSVRVPAIETGGRNKRRITKFLRTCYGRGT